MYLGNRSRHEPQQIRHPSFPSKPDADEAGHRWSAGESISLNFLFRLHIFRWPPEMRRALREQNSIQVIDLMLEDACQPAPCLDLGRLAMTVQSLHLYSLVAFHLTNQIRDGETALHAQQSLFRSLNDLWI